ncbi:MAG: VOC family protein [Neisseriaceae bacterium]|nr:VOC family protein [Neisseriaceae bacterium]MBP6862689.1 VOC family protein [Neisseriaceae bacterium]
MKLAYAIVYVPDVVASIEFFEQALGLKRRFVHESLTYAELETGATVLAFANLEAANELVAGGCVFAHESEKPLGMELAFVTEDVTVAYERALAAGAVAVLVPVLKPWGQTVAYVRTPEGILIELCTAVSA